jgi:hypothetical protein
MKGFCDVGSDQIIVGVFLKPASPKKPIETVLHLIELSAKIEALPAIWAVKT